MQSTHWRLLGIPGVWFWLAYSSQIWSCLEVAWTQGLGIVTSFDGLGGRSILTALGSMTLCHSLLPRTPLISGISASTMSLP